MNRVTRIDPESLTFDNDMVLYSYHEVDCCESHYLDFSNLTMTDFDGLEFDLSGDGFFEKIEDFGIRLIPIKGHAISVPGYGSNNGYYSSYLTLILSETDRSWDISECQEISE